MPCRSHVAPAAAAAEGEEEGGEQEERVVAGAMEARKRIRLSMLVENTSTHMREMCCV